MRFGNWRGAPLALTLAAMLGMGLATSVRADGWHLSYTIPREVPAYDFTTGGEYYAPPVPYGHYVKDKVGIAMAIGCASGYAGQLHGCLNDLWDSTVGLFHCCGNGCGHGTGCGHGSGCGNGSGAGCGLGHHGDGLCAGGNGCGFCSGLGLFHHGDNGFGVGCGTGRGSRGHGAGWRFHFGIRAGSQKALCPLSCIDSRHEQPGSTCRSDDHRAERPVPLRQSRVQDRGSPFAPWQPPLPILRRHRMSRLQRSWEWRSVLGLWRPRPWPKRFSVWRLRRLRPLRARLRARWNGVCASVAARAARTASTGWVRRPMDFSAI